MPTVRLRCASALSFNSPLIIGLSLFGCPGPLYTDTSQCSLYRLQTFSSHDSLLTIPSHILKSTYFAPTCQLVVVVCPRRHKQQPFSAPGPTLPFPQRIPVVRLAAAPHSQPLPTMYRSTLRSLRSSTRSLHLPTASARPSPVVNSLSTTSTRFFSTSKAARAIAAPAVGDYHKAESGEPTLNSPSELARRISSKVLPRLEKPDVKKVLVVGSGGLSIGQAGEFDYSGACASRVCQMRR